jgi:hypothetical protein
MRKTIEDMVVEMERHKVVFLPSKQAYLDFIFEFNYQLFELSGETPVSESSQFIPCVKAFINDDLEIARKWYYKHDKPYKLWCPDVKYARKYAKDYLKRK